MAPSQRSGTPGAGWLPSPPPYKRRRAKMNYEEYGKLTEEEQKKFFETLETNAKELSDRDAEISSLKKELEENRLTIEEGKKSLAATKELNYTLARKLDTSGSKKSFEDTLHEVFGKDNK